MTLFVVNLFLPDTINFNLPTSPSIPRSSSRQSRRGARPTPLRQQNPTTTTTTTVPPIQDTAERPSLFTPTKTVILTGPTSPQSPVRDVAYEEFFAQNNTKITTTLNQPSSLKPPSDFTQPAWGRPTARLNQPRSRASSPPSSSILNHNQRSINKAAAAAAAALGRAGLREPRLGARSESYDRVFANADWTIEPGEQGNGGLRHAVEASVRTGSLTDKIWVGTLGMPTDALEDTQQKQEIEDRLATERDSLTVFCKDSDFDGHYTHFCKQILWPVFHYHIPDHPKSKAYEDHSWVYYVKVNQAFAEKILKNWKRGDVIWIHDYHLLLVPKMIRDQLPDAKIGFFLHVAFPSSEVFRCLAVRKELLEGVLGANLIGFQIHEYARHFLQTCSRLLCVEATTHGVQLEDRFVDVIDLAIGIDPVALDSQRKEVNVANWLSTLQERYRGKKLIVARDKLDHVRGVRQKLLAYELFLNKYPAWRDKVVMIQVATSTTEQQVELDATVSDIVTRVNSSWANLAYQPLVYLKQDIRYSGYLALLTVADALMVTSQREGMNLTCHEYLFCQDGKFAGHNKNGSLILSEFTGSASVFGGNELSVNPWDYRQCAEAIKTALEMGDEEKQRRWNALYQAVMHHTADHWFDAFLKRLDAVYETQHRRGTLSVPRLSMSTLGQQYHDSAHRLFFLDYEGTLASWGSPNNIILTSPQRTLDVLNDLLLDDRNIVYVMSGRTPEELDQLFKRAPSLGLIAENGCFIKDFDSNEWAEKADPLVMQAWKDSVEGIMNYYQERTPGSWIEVRHCCLIFHYRNCEDMESAVRHAGDCASHINDACEEQRVRAIPVDGAVVVEPFDWSKETAAREIFDNLACHVAGGKVGKKPDFLMVVGDGREDEVLFRWANGLHREGEVKNVASVSLGSRNTEAMNTLTQGVTGVLTALQKLAAMS